MYDNRITKLEHLDQVPNLNMLYLQKNQITVIENLSHLKKLKKLYLSNNKISVIENLEELKALTGRFNDIDRSYAFRYTNEFELQYV